MKKRYTNSKAVAPTPNANALRLGQAYQRTFGANATQDDCDMVLVDLTKISGYYRRPNYSDWMQRTKSPDGFELHCALSNARAEVVQHLMDFLNLDDDALIALEQAAKRETQQ